MNKHCGYYTDNNALYVYSDLYGQAGNLAWFAFSSLYGKQLGRSNTLLFFYKALMSNYTIYFALLMNKTDISVKTRSF